MSQETKSEAGNLGGIEDNTPEEDGNLNNGNTAHENTENTSQEDIVTTQEMTLHLGLPPLEPLYLRSGNISEN